jgi:hypothetical protein
MSADSLSVLSGPGQAKLAGLFEGPLIHQVGLCPHANDSSLRASASRLTT